MSTHWYSVEGNGAWVEFITFDGEGRVCRRLTPEHAREMACELLQAANVAEDLPDVDSAAILAHARGEGS